MKYEIEQFPLDQSQPYSMTVGIEGNLSIVDCEKTFFNESGILLLEFSQSLESWIKKLDSKDNLDFYYASMDFEEEPIIAFNYEPTRNLYRLHSVWGKDPIFATKNDLVNSSKMFINDLNASIQERLVK